MGIAAGPAARGLTARDAVNPAGRAEPAAERRIIECMSEPIEGTRAGQATDETASAEAASGEMIGADTPGQANTTEKDPSEWVTGDEPMTGAQRSYLDTLARAAGEQLPASLTKAEASEHIERLQEKTGRGRSD